jgi:aspartyl-tRNA(Asn)/glutamyl-tRNA(Gln) amidotransferase subunit B
MADLDYKIVVGLEIHVHLATKTKIFCGCELVYGDTANTHVCPVCLGMPGSLPVMNKKALEHSILTGLALNCKIAPFTKWDRKSYYYPDLPKNYQISQYDLPFSEHGYIEIPLADGTTKKIRITRAHLEEDAGKNTHTLGNFSAIDLNRAGTPLLEIVTEPDMNSPAEVGALARELQRIVRYLGVSEADMQKGHMRFEPNINLHITRNGETFKTPISEVKNLNSFRAVERSIAYEARRQYQEFLDTGKTLQMGNKCTYGWDDDNQMTVLQREKEEAHDYRYFPDPDLVPVKVDEDWLGEIKSRLCELPAQMQQRFVSKYGLSDYDAGVLTADRATGEFFDNTVKLGTDAKRVCNLLTQTGLKLANEKGITVDQLGITTENLAQLAKMVDASVVSASAATTFFVVLAAAGGDPLQFAE